MLGDTFRKQKGIKRYKRPSKGHQVVLEKTCELRQKRPARKLEAKIQRYKIHFASFRFMASCDWKSARYLRRLRRRSRLPLIKVAAVARCLGNAFFSFKSQEYGVLQNNFCTAPPKLSWSLILTSEIQTIHSIHHSSNSTWAMVFPCLSIKNLLLACVEEAQRSLLFAGKSGFCILPRIFILTVKGCYGCCKDKVTWDSLRGSSTSAADTQVAFGMCEWDRVGGVWGVCVCGAPVFPKRHCGHIYASPLIDLFPCLLYNLACFFCLLMPWWAERHVPGSACLAIWIARCHAFARIQLSQTHGENL